MKLGKNILFREGNGIEIRPQKGLTGCGQTSAFANKCKKTAWETRKVFSEVTDAFNTSNHMSTKESITAAMSSVEQYVVFVYDRASTGATVDEAHRDLFTRKGRAIESIPPTSAALVQHVKQAACQAGYCWGHALVAVPDIPCPSSWGWHRGPDQTSVYVTPISFRNMPRIFEVRA